MSKIRYLRQVPWLLLMPTAILALLFLSSPRTFHSDDIGYWMMAQQWRELLANRLLAGFSGIYLWPATRPTFHPLLGVPLLWIFHGKIDPAVVCFGLILSLVINISLYTAFRRFALPKPWAVLCAIAVATFPHFLGQGRFFMAEFPCVAFSFAALACLLSRRYFGFSLFYFCALLERPLEGGMLLPTFFLLGFLVEPGTNKLSFSRSLAATAATLLLTIVTYLGIAHSFLPWIARTSFSSNGLQPWRNIKLSGRLADFLLHSLFHFYGLTGLVVLIAALVLLGVKFRERARPLAGYLAILAMLLAVLSLIGNFDNGLTVDASWRYSLAFVLMVIFCALVLLVRYGRQYVAGALIGAFLAANLSVLAVTASGSDVFSRLPLAGSALYHREVINSGKIFFYGIAPMVEDLAKLLPGETLRVLFVGESRALEERWFEIALRCKEKLGVECSFQYPPDDYRLQIFDRELPRPSLMLSQYRIGAIVFAREHRIEDRKTQPYPSAKLYGAMSTGMERELGLVKAGEIATPFPYGPRTLEVYRADSRR